MHKGSCLCGAVAFEVDAPLDKNDACHCAQCRKWSGHYSASADVPRAALRFVNGEDRLSWYATAKAQRGFCSVCGSSLLFDPLDRVKHDWIGVELGCIDGPTGTKLSKHIFVADKGDYYDLADGLPQHGQ